MTNGKTEGPAHRALRLIGLGRELDDVRGSDGKLDLGPWEQVFYPEFDGRRRKRVVLKAIGD